MKLLYAEDEPAMAEAVTDILEYHNFTVDTVYDGAEALAYAREEHYDGIILDVMMPSRCCASCGKPVTGPPCFSSRRRRRSKIGLPGSIWERTTIFQSPLPPVSCWRGCVRCSGGGRTIHRMFSAAAISPSTPPMPSCNAAESPLFSQSWNSN